MTVSQADAAAPSPAPTARRAGLDRDDVVDAALALVEEGGPSALTMRKLATHLGVTPTTIYWHVGGRDDLVLAVIRRLSARLAERPVVGDEPAERIVSAVTNIFDSARAHRRVTALAHQVGAASLLELPQQVVLARELEAAGLHGVAARDALRALMMTTAGFLVVALQPERSAPDQLNPATLWATADTEGLSSATVAALGRAPAMGPLFEATVRAVVDGILAEAGDRDDAGGRSDADDQGDRAEEHQP